MLSHKVTEVNMNQLTISLNSVFKFLSTTIQFLSITTIFSKTQLLEKKLLEQQLLSDLFIFFNDPVLHHQESPARNLNNIKRVTDEMIKY